MATKCTRSMTCRCPDCSAAMEMFTAKDLVAVASSKVDFTTATDDKPLVENQVPVKKQDSARPVEPEAVKQGEKIEPTAPVEKKKGLGLPTLAERKMMMKQKLSQAQQQTDDDVVIAAPAAEKAGSENFVEVITRQNEPGDKVDTTPSVLVVDKEVKLSSRTGSVGSVDCYSEELAPPPSLSLLVEPIDTRTSRERIAAGASEEALILDQWPKSKSTAIDSGSQSAGIPVNKGVGDLISPRLSRLVPLESDPNQSLLGDTSTLNGDDALKSMVRRRRTGPRFSKAFTVPEAEGSTKENVPTEESEPEGFSVKAATTERVNQKREEVEMAPSEAKVNLQEETEFIVKKRAQDQALGNETSTREQTQVSPTMGIDDRPVTQQLPRKQEVAVEEDAKQVVDSGAAGEEIDYSSMNISDRLASTDWKARKSGYEELTKTPVIDSNLLALLGNSLGNEAHAGALDTVLEACLEAVKRGPADVTEENSRASRWVPALGKRCFTGRPVTRQRAIDLVLELFEVDSPKAVANALVGELTSKNAKVVVACLACLRDACSQFGAGRVVPAQSLVSAIEISMSATPPAIRAEGCGLAVDVIGWLGDSFKVLLNSKLATDAQRKELERRLKEEMAKNGGSLPQKAPTRFRKGEEAKAKSQIGGSNSAAAVDVHSNGDDDTFELLTVHDVLSKLEKPIELEKRLKDPKWSERKDVLLEVETACGKPPRLAPGDYAPLVAVLKKTVVNDSHQAVVIQALNVLLTLSQGLRQSFAPNARGALMILLEKLRDQKKPITAAVDLVLDSFSKYCFSIGDERVIAIVGDAVSSPKATPVQLKNMMLWIERNCSNGKVVSWPNQTFNLSPLRDVVKTKAGHPDPSVRQAANAALNSLKPAETASVGGASSSAAELPTSTIPIKKPAATTAATTTAARAVGSSTATTASKSSVPGGLPPPAPSNRSTATGATSHPQQRLSNSSVTSSASYSSMSRRPSASTIATRPASGSVDSTSTRNTATKLEASSSQMADEILTGMYRLNPSLKQAVQLEKNSTRWEERAGVLTALCQALRNATPNSLKGLANLEAMLRFIGSKTKEFQDSNPTVMQAAWECVRLIIEKSSDPCDYFDSTIIPTAASKLPDRKQNPMATQILMELSSGVCGPAWTMSRMLRCSRSAASPKTKQAIYDWLSECVVEFGLEQLYWKEDELTFEDFIRVVCSEDGVMNTSHEVRSSATSLLGEICKQLGVTRFQRLPHIPPSVSLECQRRVAGTTLLPPNRVWRFRPAGSQSNTFMSGDDGADARPVDVSHEVEPLLPILLTSDAPSWKKREEALIQVERVFTPKRPVVMTRAIKELTVALGKRLDDTQRNLAARAAVDLGVVMECVGATATASLIKSFGERLIMALSDTKKNVASACQTTMTLAVCHNGRISTQCLSAMLQQCVEPLKSGKVDKVKLLAWICERLEEREEQGLIPPEETQPGFLDPLKQVVVELIPPLVTCFTAKEAPARKSAVKIAEIIAALLSEQVAATRFRSGIRDLKVAEQRLVGPMVEEVLQLATGLRRKRMEEQEKQLMLQMQVEEDHEEEEEEGVEERYHQEERQQEQEHDEGVFVKRFQQGNSTAMLVGGAATASVAMPRTPPPLHRSPSPLNYPVPAGGIVPFQDEVYHHGDRAMMMTPSSPLVPNQQLQHPPVEEFYTPQPVVAPSHFFDETSQGGGETPFRDVLNEEEEDYVEEQEEEYSFEYLVEMWNPDTEVCRVQLKRFIAKTFSSSLADQLFGDRKTMSKALQALDSVADQVNRSPVPVLLWTTIFFSDEESHSPLIASLVHLLIRTLETAGKKHRVQLNDFEASAFIPYLLNRFTDLDKLSPSLKNGLTTALQNVSLVYRVERNLRFLCRYASAEGLSPLVQSECLMEAARLMEESPSGIRLLEDDPEIVSRIARCLSTSADYRTRVAALHLVETVFIQSERNINLVAEWFGMHTAQALMAQQVVVPPQQQQLIQQPPKAMPLTPPSPQKSPMASSSVSARGNNTRHAQQQPTASSAAMLNTSTASAASSVSSSLLPPLTYTSQAEKTLKTKVRDIQEYEVHLVSTLAPSAALTSPIGNSKVGGNKEALLLTRAEAALKFIAQHVDGPSPLLSSGVDDFEWARLVEECFDVSATVKSCGRILEQLALRGATPASWRKTSWLCHTSRLVLNCLDAVFRNKSLQVLADSECIEVMVESLLVLHARVKSSSSRDHPSPLIDLVEQVVFGSITMTPYWLICVLRLKPVMATASDFLVKGLVVYCSRQERIMMKETGEDHTGGEDEDMFAGEEDEGLVVGVDLEECLKQAKRNTWVPVEVIRALERMVGEDALEEYQPPQATFLSPTPPPVVAAASGAAAAVELDDPMNGGDEKESLLPSPPPPQPSSSAAGPSSSSSSAAGPSVVVVAGSVVGDADDGKVLKAIGDDQEEITSLVAPPPQPSEEGNTPTKQQQPEDVQSLSPMGRPKGNEAEKRMTTPVASNTLEGIENRDDDEAKGGEGMEGEEVVMDHQDGEAEETQANDFEEDEFEFLVGKIKDLRANNAEEEETRMAIAQLARFRVDHKPFFLKQFPPEGVIVPEDVFAGESRLFQSYLRDKLNDEDAVQAMMRSTTPESPGDIKRGLDKLLARVGL